MLFILSIFYLPKKVHDQLPVKDANEQSESDISKSEMKSNENQQKSNEMNELKDKEQKIGVVHKSKDGSQHLDSPQPSSVLEDQIC